MTLSTVERVLFLRGVQLFSQIPGEELAPVAQVAQVVTFRAGETFISQGQDGDCLFIIVDGRVEILVRGVGKVTERGPQEVIGEMAVMSRRPRTATCVATTNLTLLKINHDDFWDLMTDKSEIALGVIQVLTLRLDEAIGNLSEFSHPSYSDNTEA